MQESERARLEATLEGTLRRLAALETRVGRLEREGLRARDAGEALTEGELASGGRIDDPADDFPADDLKPAATRAVFLLGRSTLILAGAFLLRALTDGGTLPNAAGFALGIVYALGLIGLADRAGTRQDRAGAVAYGLTAVLVAIPFVVETTGLLKIVSPYVGGAALIVLAGTGLLTAARTGSRLLAAAFTGAALGVILLLYVFLSNPLFFTGLLLALGVGTLLLAYTRGWRIERWFPAAAVDALVLIQVMAVPDGGDGASGRILALALALLVVYLGIFTFRALIQNKVVGVFYVLQSIAVLMLGYGGAVRVATRIDSGAVLLGWLAVAAAGFYYTVAFTLVRKIHGRGGGFFYFATLALVFLLLGCPVLVSGIWLSAIWISLGLAATLLGGRFDRVSLRAHSAVYLTLVSLQSGLMGAVWDAFVAGADAVWRQPGAAGGLALLVAISCYGLLVGAQRGRRVSTARRVPRFCVALLALGGLGWAAVWLLLRLLGQVPPAASAAMVAVVRTGVLAVVSVLLAAAGRRQGWVELTWPVYPLLALGSIQLLLEDLRRGTPVTLTVAFTLLGTALILAPRLLHTGRSQADVISGADR